MTRLPGFCCSLGNKPKRQASGVTFRQLSIPGPTGSASPGSPRDRQGWSDQTRYIGCSHDRRDNWLWAVSAMAAVKAALSLGYRVTRPARQAGVAYPLSPYPQQQCEKDTNEHHKTNTSFNPPDPGKSRSANLERGPPRHCCLEPIRCVPCTCDPHHILLSRRFAPRIHQRSDSEKELLKTQLAGAVLRRWKSPPGSNDALILVKKCVKHWILIATRRSVPRRCECERRRPIPQAGVRGRLCRRGYVTWVLDGKPEGPFPLQQLRTP